MGTLKDTSKINIITIPHPMIDDQMVLTGHAGMREYFKIILFLPDLLKALEIELPRTRNRMGLGCGTDS